MRRPPGGEVLIPQARRLVRRRPRPEPVSEVAEGIVRELRPLADHVPPPVLGAAVRRHMEEMSRLIWWLRE